MKMCSIASGSSGNCIYVGSEKAAVLIDTGISGKRIEAGLREIGSSPDQLTGILITHEHSDHIQGLGVMSRRYKIPVYATAGTIHAMMKCSSLGKMPDGIFHEIKPDQLFGIGDLEIQPFRISHDAADPVGYRISHGGKSLAVATDMGYYNDYIVENLSGLDALLLEANHDVNMLQVGTYPYNLKQRILGKRGHLSNVTAGRLLCEVLNEDLHTILLGHLSRENNYEDLAYETVCAEVTMGDNPYCSKDFHISVAKRDCVSEVIEV